VTPAPAITFGNNTLQNGADAVALYQADAADFPSGTGVTTTDLVDAIVYDTDDADDTALWPLLNTGEPQVNEDQNNDKDTESLQRIPNGAGGARSTSAYATAIPTPGAPNRRIFNADQTETYATIRSAVDAASAGETIAVSEGMYTVGAQRIDNFKQGLNIEGASENGVIIDATDFVTDTGSSWPFYVSEADDVTLKDFTVWGPVQANAWIDDPGNPYPSTAYTGFKADFSENLTLENVTVKGSAYVEMDFNNIRNLTLTNVTADGGRISDEAGTEGVGFALTGVEGAILNSVSTSSNNWGGAGIFDTGLSRISPPSGWTAILAPTDIEITNSTFGEAVSVYTDEEFASGIGNLILPNFNYTVENPDFRDDGDGRGGDFVFYKKTEQGAVDLAADDLSYPNSSFIRTLARDGSGVVSQTGNFIVGTSTGGRAMRIQAAVVAAGAGDEIKVTDGTYAESVTLDKALTLRGAAMGGSMSSSLSVASKSTSPNCTAGAVIDASGGTIGFTVSADDVTLENLCVTGAQNHNIYTDASISNLTLTGVETLNAGNYGLEIHNDAIVTGLSITNSTFSGNSVGMRIRGTVNDLDIVGSAFDHNNYGFYTTLGGNVEEERADGGSTNVSDVTITNTTFNDNPNKGIYAEKLDNATFENIEVINSGTDVNASFFPQAIDINLKLSDYGAITVRNSEVRGSIGEGLNVKARNGFYGGAYGSPNNASLASLTVENSIFEGNRWGIVVGYGVEGATIKGNLVSNNGNAIESYQDRSNLDFNRGGVLFYATPEEASFMANENCITENGLTERNGFTGYGLSTTDTPVDATDNWWGSAAGPGTGGANGVDGPVDADPIAIDPVSGVEGCGGETDSCEASEFKEIIVSNQPPGKVEITINDTEGIEQVRFYEVSNFDIASNSGDFTDQGDGIWIPETSGDEETSFTLTQVDTDNPEATYYAQITNRCGTLTDIDPPHGFEVAPSAFALDGNYPNPFRAQTTIAFDLPEQTDVTLTVYDVMGRKVATLVDRSMPAGPHAVAWNGHSDQGSKLASGVYFYRLRAGETSYTERMTIVR
jgi:hypothetical protein